MLTIIFSYREEHNCLQQWVRIINEVCSRTKDVSFIIVDDASISSPAIGHLSDIDSTDNVSLFRVQHIIGYNMYGCRNLAMKETKTAWNLLCNVSTTLSCEDILSIKNLIETNKLKDNKVYEFGNLSIENNVFLITKSNFWEAGGYDHEWVGIRGGQCTTIARIEKICEKDVLPFLIVHNKSYSNDGVVDDRINPLFSVENYNPENTKKLIHATIEQRLTSSEPMPKLNFKWSKQL